jgi:hypothetical protein
VEPFKAMDWAAWPPPSAPACNHSSAQLIRQRRSAVDFDGVTHITREKFLAILDATLPRASAPPFDAWPFAPRLHLVLFVHRVTGLDPGLYLWLRTPADAAALCQSFHAKFKWEAAQIPSPRRRCIGWAGATCVILRGRSLASRILPLTVPSAWGCWRGLNRCYGNAARRPTANYSGKPA